MTVSTQDLIRAGLMDLTQARHHLDELDAMGWRTASWPDLLSMLDETSDPDTALSSLVRLVGIWHETHIDPIDNVPALRRLVAVLGTSQEMGMLMRSRPELVDALGDSYERLDILKARGRVDDMMRAVDAAVRHVTEGHGSCTDEDGGHKLDPHEVTAVACSAMRSAYRRQLAVIMAQDAGAEDPTLVQPQISHKLSDLADAALSSALAIAKREADPSNVCRISIIAMGKLGSRELNYVSDVDLIYVAEPARDEVDQSLALTTATDVVTLLQRLCQSTMPNVSEPPLWKIDGGLRPEGKDGPLVRRLDSHRQYYGQWAKSWEFQALLKARFAAGDEVLGRDYEAMIDPFVWSASQRDNFVLDCRQMRKRVEDTIPDRLKDREIKLGEGGLRDVEFSVQMLQLVHGRSDTSLRVRSTLDALTALSDGGYISHRDAATLSSDYRFERVLEHRQQMFSLKRTHLFPDLGDANRCGLEHPRVVNQNQLEHNRELRRLARVFGLHPEELVTRYDATRRQIRQLHLEIYYRPMLPISAQLDDDDVSLSPEAARDRFHSIGFGDADAAMRHVKALTEGVTRAAKINRIILPAVLRWLGLGQDPDMGLLFYNRIEQGFGEDSDYLGLLRDSTSAAQRLCHILSNSRYLGEALNKSVTSVVWLGNDDDLRTPSREIIDSQCRSIVERHADSQAGVSAGLRALRRREIERVGLAWMSGVVDVTECLRAMTQMYDAVIDAALDWAISRRVRDGRFSHRPADIALIAMGRYGGGEVNFSSDADVIIVYRATGEGLRDQARVFAQQIVDDLLSILKGSLTVEPKLDLDLDLRPEGKNGLLVRSYNGFVDYYSSWASTWERQALLRARFAAGDKALADDLLREVIDPFRYPDSELTSEQICEIRTLKARMEAERLPRGVKRNRHMKLGYGGLSDVEWTVQLMQLLHAHEHPQLRVQGTLETLDLLETLGCISTADAVALRDAWVKCTAARNGNYLFSSRAARADILPDDLFSLGGIAVYLGYGAKQGQQFDNDLRHDLRRCREVVERLFYGQS